jgi:hypothetical protein
LTRHELGVSYIAPPILPSLQALPDRLGVRGTFDLVRLSPFNSVSWTGSAKGNPGTVEGILSLPGPAARSKVNGVFLQRLGSVPKLVGLGLVRIPIVGTGLPSGSFETAGIRFEN